MTLNRNNENDPTDVARILDDVDRRLSRDGASLTTDDLYDEWGLPA